MLNTWKEILALASPVIDSIKMSAIYDIGKFGLGQIRRHMFSEKEKSTTEPPCEMPGHILRLCTDQEHPEMGNSYAFSLLDCCMEHPCVALLGEAGCGKTQELQWIEYCCYKDANLPRTVRIRLRTYTNESMIQLAEQYGVEPENRENLLFLIDGFDEIAGVHKQNFLKQVELYRNENKEARFLISTRNHFYRNGIFGEEFKAVWLQPLTEEDVKGYIESLDISYENWKNQIEQQRLTEAIKNPFYLVELGQVYLECGAVPERKQLMQILTERKISQDLEKYRMTGKLEFQETVEKMEILLERLAVAMHAMDTRVFSEAEYEQLIPCLEKRELLKYSGIWVQRDGNWEFSHNNFGEYLAAKYLTGCSLSDIQKLVCMGYPELGVSRNWYHVLSYLISIGDIEVKDWLLQQDFTLFLDTDWTNIPASDRSMILLQEWEQIKQRHIWPWNQNYRIRDLVEFGMDYTAIRVFIKEIHNPQDTMSLKNAIQILGYSPSLYGCQLEVREMLLSVLLTEQQDKWALEYTLAALLNLQLMDAEMLSTLLKYFWNSDVSEVRYPLYVAIRVLGQADTQIDFLLEGIPYIAGMHQERLGNETLELQRALLSITGVPAARKLLEALISNHKYGHMYGSEKLINCAVTCMENAYTGQKDENWFAMERYYCTFHLSAVHSVKETIMPYFEHTGTKCELFYDLLKKVGQETDRYTQIQFLLPLLDERISEWIFEQYQKQTLNDTEAKCCLGLITVENPVFEKLRTLYQNRTNTQMETRGFYDHETCEQDGTTVYDQAVTDRNAYIGLLETFLNIMNVEDVSMEEVKRSDEVLRRIAYRRDLQNVLADYRRYADKRDTVRQWIELLLKQDDVWEWLQVKFLVEWMSQDPRREIPAAMEKIARTFYEKYIDQVDFSTCQIWNDHEHFQPGDWKCEYLIYFADRLDLHMDLEKAKGLLRYCSYRLNLKMKSIIQKSLTEEVLCQEISHNLLEKDLKGYPLSVHLRLCGKYGCEECVEKVRQIALNQDIPEYIREDAVDAFMKLTDELAVCSMILPELNGHLWRHTAENLIQVILEKKVKNTASETVWKRLLADQIWTVSQNVEEYRMTAYMWLIQMQDIRGLRAYRKLLEQKMEVPGRDGYAGPVEAIAVAEKLELWPELARLTELCFRPEFKDREYGGLFNSLNRAWTKVAAGSEKGYLLVRDVLDGLKSQYEGDLNREAWINKWIYHVEEARKQRIQERWSVTQVLQWLER